MKWTYYNEFDKHAAAWLRELIKRGLISDGEVDERSICDVKPDDIRGFRRVHFFAGIGGWELALRLAGWSEDRPAWTGSCPCQPFSSAGKQLAQADERHLWPVMFNLIRECRPNTVFGEQVERSIRKGWLDGISADLEAEKYACGHCVLGAHSVGAPHKRQRLYWVADAGGKRWEGYKQEQCISEPEKKAFSVNGDPLARARRALVGDFIGLLQRDGVSVGMERSALKGYGNAIVPQVAAEFIGAFMDVEQNMINSPLTML